MDKYGVVMHDYMRDYLDKEFVFVYGETRKQAAEKAWEKLKKEMGEDISELTFDDEDSHATKTRFVSRVSKIRENGDCEYFSEPFALHVQLFELPIGKGE